MNQLQVLFYETRLEKQSIEVYFEEETFWLSQKKMAELFGVEVNTINYHLKEIFKSGELDEKATIRKFRIVQTEGSHKVAMQLTKKEYESFRVKQDRDFESDFDQEVKRLSSPKKKK